MSPCTKQLAISLMLFHPQTSSYLLSQLFVIHLGVALLVFFSFLDKTLSGLKNKVLISQTFVVDRDVKHPITVLIIVRKFYVVFDYAIGL